MRRCIGNRIRAEALTSLLEMSFNDCMVGCPSIMRLSVLGHVVASLRHCCVAEVSNKNPVCYATLSEGEWPRGRSILSRLPTNRSTSSSMKEVRDPWARERMLVKLMVRTVAIKQTGGGGVATTNIYANCCRACARGGGRLLRNWPRGCLTDKVLNWARAA